MLDYNGMEMVTPYIGCISGCVTNYCYLFGKEVTPLVYLGVQAFIYAIVIFILVKIFRKIKERLREKNKNEKIHY